MTLDHSEFVPESPRGHYVFIDGPSLDRTLGEVLGGPPTYETRPDWRRVERFVPGDARRRGVSRDVRGFGVPIRPDSCHSCRTLDST